ncbi:hypothetical protein SAMN05216556_11119 [Aequorivita viscosa]|uniref:4-alpha-L-fucosyltransferase glycosyl transferase group 56 n=1 Tax=Aequorivita viscosa TaxID=797419 RepID=A0A1M6GIT5_9FLAO|nr:hypothetical protein SAMN05216556_11119 [Aequorivita viscosa]SHJ09828.1 hypothetical protein SAMN04487908_10994 [Aequorivita viscosa]
MHRLIHFHTDHKFIHDTLKYNSELLENIIVFIGDADNAIINKLNNLKFEFYIFNESQVDNINNILPHYDGVVIYDLNNVNIQILERITRDKKVFLRLFGYELYKLKLNKFVSRATLRLFKPISLESYSFKNYLKKKVKRLLGIEFSFNYFEQKLLYSKIDAIILINKFEYQALQKYFYLPKFIQLPLTRELPKNLELSNKSNKLIIGNSRNIWNNHLDVFRIIKKSKRFDNYKFNLFFNYGADNDYTEKVRNKANQNSFVLIEDFLDIQEFSRVYNTATALIINSYRQHALGNILTAISSGTKVYLNRRSSTYKWLKHEGFYISEISELPRDIDNNKVRQTQKEFQHNANCYNQLKENYTQLDFIANVKAILEQE